MIQLIKKINRVSGELKLPGDKSISHRSVMFSALAGGKSKIVNLLESADIYSTISCFKDLGCTIEKVSDEWFVTGNGVNGLESPSNNLDAGNSGTTARLISGILAAQNFSSVLKGDESLSKRPMNRIAEPLRLMGADIELSEGHLPAKFRPVPQLNAINFELPVGSAQVKSAVLLAGLHLDEESTVTDCFNTRDHTERMLNLPVEYSGDKKIIKVSSKNYPSAREYVVPSDISTAAFFIVLTLLSPKSELLLKDISLNPSRTGILKVLKQMGADISIENERNITGEDLGDIIVKSSSLKNISIDENLIPNIIDEIPILSVAGLFAEGAFKITNAKELRYKESDRIKSICENYRTLGLEVEEFEDGFLIDGDIKNVEAIFESNLDHRIAMSFAILSSVALHQSKINNFECVSISNPKFLNQLQSITQ